MNITIPAIALLASVGLVDFGLRELIKEVSLAYERKLG